MTDTRFLRRLAVALALCVMAGAATTASADDIPGVLLSRQLMEARGLQPGDLVTLAADASGRASKQFRVVDVYEPTPDPMRFAQPSHEARLHLPDLLALTAATGEPAGDDRIGGINVALVDGANADQFARDVSARVPGILARSTSAPNDRTSTFVVIERFHLAVAIVTMLGSAVFLLALMMLVVDERRDTVGTLRLIGLTRSRILTHVFAEGALIALAGTAFGIVFAVTMQGAFNRFFQWRYDTALVFVRITPGVIARSVLLAVPLGIAASIIASWTLLRRHPLALVRR